MARSDIGSIFEEFGVEYPEEISLDKVNSDRRELDKILMSEILGLSDKEQLEVYKAIIRLVKERIERTKSHLENLNPHIKLIVKYLFSVALDPSMNYLKLLIPPPENSLEVLRKLLPDYVYEDYNDRYSSALDIR